MGVNRAPRRKRRRRAPLYPSQTTSAVGRWRRPVAAPRDSLFRTFWELFHRDPVGTRRARGEGRVEVEFEPRVFGEGIVRDLDDADLVVAFKVNEARGVLVQEVVRDHKSVVFAAQYHVVRSGVLAEAND